MRILDTGSRLLDLAYSGNWKYSGKICNRAKSAVAIFYLIATSLAVAQPRFPPDFDPKNKYPTTSYAELFDYVKLTRGTSDEYVGKRFKLIVRVPVTPYGNINATVSKMPWPAYIEWYKPAVVPQVEAPGCIVCSSTWPITSPQNALTSDIIDAAWQNFSLYIVLKDDATMRQFFSGIVKCALDENNKLAHLGCIGVIAGTLDREIVDFKASLRPFGPAAGKTTIPFLRIEKIAMYRDEDDQKRQWEKIGDSYLWAGKILSKVFASGK